MLGNKRPFIENSSEDIGKRKESSGKRNVVDVKNPDMMTSKISDIRGRPNKHLTEDQKIEKRKLKKRLKAQQRINKLQTRIKHAISRKDQEIEKKARLELNSFYKETANDEKEFLSWRDDNGLSYLSTCSIDNSIHASQSHLLCSNSQSQSNNSAKKLLLDVTKKLFCNFVEEKHFKVTLKDTSTTEDEYVDRSTHSTSTKEHQTQCAIKLLKNMTKGTQSQSMFDNKAALLGYTRQKFYERAMLLYTTLEKLKPKYIYCDLSKEVGQKERNDSHLIRGMTPEQNEIIHKIWKRIDQGKIRKACAIGCGPGNDATGLLAFLHLCHLNNMNNSKSLSSSACHQEIILEEIILMDWSIKQWDEAILQPLSSILNQSKLMCQSGEENNKRKHEKKCFHTCFCDVTNSFTDESNRIAREIVLESSCDIYLTSYLLSETNGKWESFYDGLINEAKEGSLFYFAEPTPWQIHRLLELFSHQLDYLWVDSSMYQPSLQSLDRRVGPAVLFAMKKSQIK